MNDVATNDLIVIEPANALAVFTTAGAIDPLLQRVRDEVDTFKAATHDVRTAKGRKAFASIAHRVSRAKVYLDGAGKELVDKQKEIPKKIDACRKHIRDTLDAWRDEVREPLTQWEQAEEARVSGHRAAIAAIDALAAELVGQSAADLRERLSKADAVKLNDACEEFVKDYAKAREAAANAIRAAIADAEKREAEQAELARLRAEQEERARRERDERIAKEAAENAVAAERDAAARRESDLLLQAEAAGRRAAEAEAAMARDAAAATTREKDKAHRARVHREALQSLVQAGIPEDCAKAVVCMIAKRDVPNVSINY